MFPEWIWSGVWGWAGEEKNELELCEIWQFQFMQVSLLWREILTFRLKEVKRSLNHIIWRTFRLSRGGERGGKVAPASFQFLLQKLAPGSPLEFCDSWSAFLLADSNELATQIPISLASPRAPVPKFKPILGERASHWGRGKTYPERPTHLQCHSVDLSEIPLGAWDGDQWRIWVGTPPPQPIICTILWCC